MSISRRSSVADVFRGTGPFPGLAVAALVVAGLLAIVALQGPGKLEWTGRALHAQERGGVVFYTVKGEQYTLDDPLSSRSGSATVYVNPHDPYDASLYNRFDESTDVLTVGGPLALAGIFLIAGVVRKRKRRRRLAAEASPGEETFGRGLDEGTVQWLLDRQRRGV